MKYKVFFYVRYILLRYILANGFFFCKKVLDFSNCVIHALGEALTLALLLLYLYVVTRITTGYSTHRFTSIM
jgi:hypothetical protein